MDADEVEVATRAVADEVAEPSWGVVVAARSIAVLVVPEDTGHAEPYFAGEGLHVLLIACCGDAGQKVRRLRIGQVGLVEAERIFGAGPGHGGRPCVVILIHSPQLRDTAFC